MILQKKVRKHFKKFRNYCLFLDLEKKKKHINEFKLNLESEFNTNFTLYNKLMGTPVLLYNSIFQLIHSVSSKFLSLNEKTLS